MVLVGSSIEKHFLMNVGNMDKEKTLAEKWASLEKVLFKNMKVSDEQRADMRVSFYYGCSATFALLIGGSGADEHTPEEVYKTIEDVSDELDAFREELKEVAIKVTIGRVVEQIVNAVDKAVTEADKKNAESN